MTNPPPVGWLRAVVIDADDPPRLAEFWATVLGVGVVENAPDWIRLEPDSGGACMAFEPREEGGPAAGASRTRPDIEVADMEVARARIEELGGRLVKVLTPRPGDSHYRMADPEGNEFCILRADRP